MCLLVVFLQALLWVSVGVVSMDTSSSGWDLSSSRAESRNLPKPWQLPENAEVVLNGFHERTSQPWREGYPQGLDDVTRRAAFFLPSAARRADYSTPSVSRAGARDRLFEWLHTLPNDGGISVYLEDPPQTSAKWSNMRNDYYNGRWSEWKMNTKQVGMLNEALSRIRRLAAQTPENDHQDPREARLLRSRLAWYLHRAMRTPDLMFPVALENALHKLMAEMEGEAGHRGSSAVRHAWISAFPFLQPKRADSERGLPPEMFDIIENLRHAHI